MKKILKPIKYRKNEIIFDGKIDDIRMNSKELDKTENFTMEASIFMDKRESFDIIDTSYYTWRIPYWYPADGKYHWNAIVVEKRKKEIRYFENNGKVLQVNKKNWAKILDIIFKPIKTWNKPAQYTLASAIWTGKN